jgi:hypothetical protein
MRLSVYPPELIAIYVQDDHRHLMVKGLTVIAPDSDNTANHSLTMA